MVPGTIMEAAAVKSNSGSQIETLSLIANVSPTQALLGVYNAF